jgi:hypothetical protein
MRDVAAGFPKDLDVQTLYAESLMNLHGRKAESILAVDDSRNAVSDQMLLEMRPESAAAGSLLR